MYKPKQLESAFIEICKKSKKNIIIGCIYRHPSMDLCEFNNELLLMDDFNIDLKVDMDIPPL